jgi:hypothetical protein
MRGDPISAPTLPPADLRVARAIPRADWVNNGSIDTGFWRKSRNPARVPRLEPIGPPWRLFRADLVMSPSSPVAASPPVAGLSFLS